MNWFSKIESKYTKFILSKIPAKLRNSSLFFFALLLFAFPVTLLFANTFQSTSSRIASESVTPVTPPSITLTASPTATATATPTATLVPTNTSTPSPTKKLTPTPTVNSFLPSSLKATQKKFGATTNTVTFTWKAAQNTDRYIVELKSTNVASTTTKNTKLELKCNVGIKYTWSVQAIQKNGTTVGKVFGTPFTCTKL